MQSCNKLAKLNNGLCIFEAMSLFWLTEMFAKVVSLDGVPAFKWGGDHDIC